MSKNKALSENKKLQIAELYDKGELSVGAIAENLGVSLRSVHNYKNHEKELPSESIVEPENKSIKSDGSLDSNEEALSNDDPETITFVGGTPFKQEKPEKPKIDWKAINEKKKRDDLIKTVVLIGGGIGALLLLSRFAKGNNQNWSQSSWNDQGTPLLYRIFNPQNQVM